MANTASALLKEAATHIGYKEGPNNDNMFGSWYGMPNQPWCAMFISYCAAKSDNADIIPRYSYCPVGVSWFKERGLWSRTPSVGAIVFYGSEGQDHTEIVESFTDSEITTIGGNTSNSGSSNGDGVYRRHVSRSSERIYGYGHPNYKPEEDPDMPKRVSLARKTELALKRNTPTQIPFLDEYSDGGDQHPDKGGPAFIASNADYIATAAATLADVASGTTIQTRFLEIDAKGATVKEGPIEEHIATGGNTYISQTRSGAVCDPGNRVVWTIELVNGPTDGKVTYAEVQANYWPR
ncbi:MULTISPECIES: CHAP domain-containing protein [Streptomyces]|uniref:Peptidase C51 domain-containing protein n=1 Tax=Streptomyces luteosporeus TaxID=173856 RepID=A0ABP6G8U0_9ACTN